MSVEFDEQSTIQSTLNPHTSKKNFSFSRILVSKGIVKNEKQAQILLIIIIIICLLIIGYLLFVPTIPHTIQIPPGYAIQNISGQPPRLVHQ